MGTLQQTVLGIAKKALEHDGYLCPVVILARDEKIIAEPLPMYVLENNKLNTYDNKTQSVFFAGAIARKVQATQLIMVWDGAFRTIPKDIQVDETEAPLSYPKSMRTECIIVNEIIFPEGKEHTLLVPYKGGDGVPVEFLDDSLVNGAEAQSRFREVAVNGYKRAEEVIKGNS